MLNNHRLVSVELSSNFSYNCKRISFDDALIWSLSTFNGWPLHSSSRLSFPLQNFFIITALPPYPKCVQKKAQNLRRNCQATNTYTSCLKPGPYLLHFHGENFHFLPPFPHSQLRVKFCFPFHSENRSNQKRSATSFHYAHASPASASTLPRPHGAPPSTGGQPCTCVPGLLPLTVLLCCATPPRYPAFPLC